MVEDKRKKKKKIEWQKWNVDQEDLEEVHVRMSRATVRQYHVGIITDAKKHVHQHLDGVPKEKTRYE